MPKLTQRISDTTIGPASGQLIIRDEELKGFGLRVGGQFVSMRKKTVRCLADA